jgi:hypothetical protein
MIARKIPVALAVAALIAAPVGSAQAQAQQQQQQQAQVDQQKAGVLATIALTTSLARAEIVGDTSAPAFAGKAKISLSLVPASKEVCYEIEVAAVDNATDAHIYKGPKGENGVSVLPLQLRADSAVSKSCAKAADDLFADISANPGNYYVQLNSKDFPKGAIRGQLSKPPE